jgi:predicted TIM-barrel fold metal-dependent hydrolase
MLGSMAALGAGMLWSAHASSAEPSTTLAAKKGRIDFHYHIGSRMPNPQKWTVEGAIEDQDRNDVAAGICSAAGSGGFTGPITNPERPRQAREWNDYAAQLGRDHRGRFGLFATLPLPNIDATLKEMEYSLDVLHADGFGILTSYGDMWLGDSKLRPAFEEMNRRKAVVFVHTTDAPCCIPSTLTYETPPMNGSWLEWPMNTARAIWSLMVNGTFRELPDIRFIFAHGGGVMPLLINRLEGFADWDSVGPEKLKALVPDGIENEFRKCYFEIAQAFTPVNMDALMKLVPSSHILFGTDTPIFPIGHTAKGFDSLKLPAKIKRAIDRENAEALLPRWKA